MTETRKSEQDRSIDETFALFQNAIAETNIVSSPAQFGRAVDPKDVSSSGALVETSVIGRAVSFVRTVAGFEPTAVQTASSSLQPPPNKQAREKPVERYDLLVDQALSMIATVPIDEPNVVEASPPSLNTRQPVDKPASKDVRPGKHPAQGATPSRIVHANSWVKKVVISVPKELLIKKVVNSESKAVQSASPSLQLPNAKQASEESVGKPRSDLIVDQALSIMGTATVDKNVVESWPPFSLDIAEAAVPSPLQPVDRPAAKDVLPLERPTQDATSPPVDHAHSTELEAPSTALKTEAILPLWQQPFMTQLSPKERLDMDLADLRRRVAIFKEHQQRFQREREEYYTTTIAKASGARGISDQDN